MNEGKFFRYRAHRRGLFFEMLVVAGLVFALGLQGGALMRIVRAYTETGGVFFTGGTTGTAALPALPVPAKAAPEPAMPTGVPAGLARILRPQAASRWLLPSLASITPAYVETVLRGALAGQHEQAWELFDLMEDTWPRLRKNQMQLKNGVCNLNKVFSPHQEEDMEATPAAKERAKLVSAAMRGMRPDPAADENALDATIKDILDAWFKGVSVLETVWHTREAGSLGSIIAPRATLWVHPTNYGWNTAGRMGLRLQGSRQAEFTEFPPDKFLICVCKTKTGSALGGALLRPLAWWWCAANFSADWLLNLAQVFGLPFRWANYDRQASPELIDRICDMLANMGSAGWAAFPEGTTMELKADGQKAGSETPQGDLLDRADKQCDLLVLGQTLTSDTGGSGEGGGSFALGKVHESVEARIICAAANFVEEVFQTQFSPSIVRLNYGDDSECPTIKLESEEVKDLKLDAEIVNTLVTAGAGKRIGLDWLGKHFGIPKPAKGEETLGEKPETVGGDAGSPSPRNLKPEDEEEAEQLKKIAAIADDTEFQNALKAYAAEL